MRVVKFILNILSYLCQSYSIALPFLMTFFVGLFGLFMYEAPGADEDVIVGSWITFCIMVILIVLSEVKLVLSIVAFAKRNRFPTKKYTIMESIGHFFALLVLISMTIVLVVFIGATQFTNDADTISLFAPSVLGVFIEVVSIILTIVNAATSKAKKSAPVAVAASYEPQMTYQQPQVVAQPQQIQSAGRFCPNCGTQVTGNFCPNCGTRFN